MKSASMTEGRRYMDVDGQMSPSNGKVAKVKDGRIGAWVKETASSPSTVIDGNILPSTSSLLANNCEEGRSRRKKYCIQDQPIGLKRTAIQ
jgi:hypothetical protein